MKTINLPPFAPTLIESTRAIGYSIETAIADIIDNSITADAKTIDIKYAPVGNPSISILDDGYGMDDEQINIAMQYGSKSPNEQRSENDLGRFGLGLKTASLSQCRQLTVASKQGNSIVARRWSIDEVKKSNEWSLIILDNDEIEALPNIEELEEKQSGTLVIWEELDRLMLGESEFTKTFGQKMDSVRDHLSLVFHRFLSGEPRKIKITMNGMQLVPADPFLVKKSTRPMDDEIILVNNERIIIRPYILPHMTRLSVDEVNKLGQKEGLRKNQGFYVYRNYRLIVWGTWFRMMRKESLSKLARIQVDIPNAIDDLWTLDIKKSTAIPPAVVRENLKYFIENLAQKSKRTWTYRGKKQTDKSAERVWDRINGVGGGVFYQLNREYPIIQSILAENPFLKTKIETLLKYIERTLPLHQLYLDLENDANIENDIDIQENDVESALALLVSQFTSPQTRNIYIEKLYHIEPFMNYPEILEKYKI